MRTVNETAIYQQLTHGFVVFRIGRQSKNLMAIGVYLGADQQALAG